MSEIKFQDLARLHRSIRAELDAAFEDVLASSAFIQGKYVKTFEEQFAEYTGSPRCLGVANGTDALEITLKAMGIGEGDTVLVPSMTFVATAEAVVNVGATPAFADASEDTLCSTAADFEAALRRCRARPKAFIAVHLHGRAADVAGLDAFARKHGLLWLEDCAQAHGAQVDGRHVGSFSRAGTFSFYPGKNLGALGDAGAVVTADPALAESIAKSRDHGRTEKYLHPSIGRGSRLDGLQAAFLSVKLKRLPLWTENRRKIAERYFENLSNVSDRLRLPAKPARREEHVHHNFVVRVSGAQGSRERVAAFLRDRGIETGIHYPLGIHAQPAYERYAMGELENTARLSREALSLPIDPLMPSEDVDAVSSALVEAVRAL